CLGGGWLMVPAALLVFFRYKRLAEKTFGGLSGDLAGWFVQTAELWMLGAFCLQQYVAAIV
ncbi:MAG: adenosylcobinamide-GDP ribazoletransferase, partial [Eubacterium sp.]|nr:adenosylcobinamide-GDP ribazoletransferase [Eubacterium sp.]